MTAETQANIMETSRLLHYASRVMDIESDDEIRSFTIYEHNAPKPSFVQLQGSDAAIARLDAIHEAIGHVEDLIGESRRDPNMEAVRLSVMYASSLLFDDREAARDAALVGRDDTAIIFATRALRRLARHCSRDLGMHAVRLEAKVMHELAAEAFIEQQREKAESRQQQKRPAFQRDRKFLELYENEKADTFHSHKNIVQWWENLTEAERQAIYPGSGRHISRDIVIEAIKKAKGERGT